MSEENKYPCTECKADDECEQQETYKRCSAWRKWFHQQWKEIRNLFARNVSNRHEDERSDDK